MRFALGKPSRVAASVRRCLRRLFGKDRQEPEPPPNADDKPVQVGLRESLRTVPISVQAGRGHKTDGHAGRRSGEGTGTVPFVAWRRLPLPPSGGMLPSRGSAVPGGRPAKALRNGDRNGDGPFRPGVCIQPPRCPAPSARKTGGAQQPGTPLRSSQARLGRAVGTQRLDWVVPLARKGWIGKARLGRAVGTQDGGNAMGAGDGFLWRGRVARAKAKTTASGVRRSHRRRTCSSGSRTGSSGSSPNACPAALRGAVTANARQVFWNDRDHGMVRIMATSRDCEGTTNHADENQRAVVQRRLSRQQKALYPSCAVSGRVELSLRAQARLDLPGSVQD